MLEWVGGMRVCVCMRAFLFMHMYLYLCVIYFACVMYDDASYASTSSLH